MKHLIQFLFILLLVPQICFAQWYQQNSGSTKNLHAVQFIDEYNGWAVGDSGLIIHTNNGGYSWIQQTSGVNLTLEDVFFIDDNTGWIVGKNEDWFFPEYIILKTINGGINWIQQISDTTVWLNDIFFINQNIGWTVGNFGTILKTTNGGNNWIPQSTPTTWPLNDVYFIDANIGFAAGGDIPGWSAHGCILKTTNGGDTWTEQMADSLIRWNGIAFSNGQNGIAVGTSFFVLGYTGQIYRTTNGGSNWLSALQMPFGYFVSVSVVNPNYGWAILQPMISGGDAVILYTNDSGINWTERGIFPEPNYPTNIYFIDSLLGWTVGGNGTIFNTINGGVPVELTSFTAASKGSGVILNWSTATEANNSGFSIERKSANSEYSVIGFVPGFGTTTETKSYGYSDSKVSAGRYIYRLKQIDFDGSYEYSPEVEVEIAAPFTFSLEQNYPNPFNPSTTIKYSIPKESKVKLTLFNLLGEEVTTLVNEEKKAGNYTLEINATSLPSGVYFYQLKAGNYMDTKKMMLIK